MKKTNMFNPELQKMVQTSSFRAIPDPEDKRFPEHVQNT